MTDKKENSGKSKASKDESEMDDLATALTSTESSLDTVRDILFGAQLRQTDQQRSDLEKRLQKSIEDLRKDSNQRMDALKADMEKMHQEIEKDAAKRSDEFNNQLATLDNTVQDLDKATSSAEADLADKIDTEVSNLNTQIENWREQLSSELDKVHSQLMHDKTDRGSLAELFSQMAEQLMSDSSVKSPKK
jgi:predicted  nucleic acid-binding Zn-ribbon protein